MNKDLHRLEDEAGRLEALVRLDAKTHSSEGSFDHITGLLRLVLGLEMATISLVDADCQVLTARQGFDLVQSPRSIAFCDIAIRSYDPLVIEDSHRDERLSQNPLVIGPPFMRSYIGAPLTTADGYNIGTICAFDTKPRQFSTRDVQIVVKCAKLVMNQLELRSEARRDFLTGVFNRRSFLTALRDELARLRRRPGAGAVAFLDIDHFKSVNDRFGHPVGDRVLRDFADLVASACRESDVLARVGGEEFAVLLPDTRLDEAEFWAERMRSQVAEAQFGGSHALKLTVSVGLVPLDDTEATSDAITKLADDALYQAKRLGRNRVVAP